MLNYEKVKDKPQIIRSLTGLSPEAFEELACSFEAAYERHLDEQDRQREEPRLRRRGGGRKAILSTIQDKLLFILFYFRMYPIQVVQGFLFGMSQAQANFWIHRLTPVLREALGYEMQLPAREPADLEEVLRRCEELEFIIDGVEVPSKGRRMRGSRGSITVARRSDTR